MSSSSLTDSNHSLTSSNTSSRSHKSSTFGVLSSTAQFCYVFLFGALAISCLILQITIYHIFGIIVSIIGIAVALIISIRIGCNNFYLKGRRDRLSHNMLDYTDPNRSVRFSGFGSQFQVAPKSIGQIVDEEEGRSSESNALLAGYSSSSQIIDPLGNPNLNMSVQQPSFAVPVSNKLYSDPFYQNQKKTSKKSKTAKFCTVLFLFGLTLYFAILISIHLISRPDPDWKNFPSCQSDSKRCSSLSSPQPFRYSYSKHWPTYENLTSTEARHKVNDLVTKTEKWLWDVSGVVLYDNTHHYLDERFIHARLTTVFWGFPFDMAFAFPTVQTNNTDLYDVSVYILSQSRAGTLDFDKNELTIHHYLEKIQID